KEEDFDKSGFKTFWFEVPGHGVTLVVDTSAPFETFIKQNSNSTTYHFKGLVMFDSSHFFINNISQNIIHKIPVQFVNYQENGTCWANTTCTNTALLNNYEKFEDIVERVNSREVVLNK
ncbi:MAG: hypothetical protein J6R29_06690, partial [Clostridia bacterium]|nr:hypothetical protein [Clostridia bacterium]